MAYTLSGLRNRVLNDKLDDTSFDPTIVTNFVNDAIRDIALSFEMPSLETIFAGTLPSGGYIFTLPPDYQQAQSLVMSGPVVGSSHDISNNYIPFRDFNRAYPSPTTRGTGLPFQWTVYASKLLFDRPTDQTYNLSMFYLRVPKTLSADGDVPEFPADFEEAIVLGAYARVLERNEDFDQAQFIKTGDYAAQLDKLTARYGKKQSAKPMTFGAPMNGSMRRKSRS